MVLKILKPFHLPKHNFPIFDKDTNDAIDTTGVVVDNANYDNGTFKDRDYDVRKYKSVAINLENIGANSIDYKVLSTTKDFVDLDADIGDDDFDKEEKAETALVARAKATGTVDLTGGASGSVDGITVDGVEIMSGTVAFNGTLTQTATDVAANITANTSNPNYTATSAGTLITITAVVNEVSTDVVVSSVTTITSTDVNMSGGAGGKAASLAIERKTPEITALRIRAKESSDGSPGTLRLDIKASER